MEKLIDGALVLLGLSEKERRFFIAVFRLGPASIQEIIKKSKIERSTAYLIASKLVEKNLILENYRSYKRTYAAVEPKALLRLVYAQERKVGRKGLEIEEHMSELQSLYTASEIRPRVRVYEGKEGLNQIRTTILAETQEILLWTNQETESLVFSQADHERFIRERLRKDISIRVLAVQNRKGEELQSGDRDFLRQTKLLPLGTYFSAEIYIYGNSVAILDFKKDIIGIVIESEQIAAAQRAIFEMTWAK